MPITFTFMHLADAFIQSDLHCIQVTVSTFLSALAFPGNRTHDLGVANAMLYQLSYRKAPITVFILFHMLKLRKTIISTQTFQRQRLCESKFLTGFVFSVLKTLSLEETVMKHMSQDHHQISSPVSSLGYSCAIKVTPNFARQMIDNLIILSTC